MYLVRPTTVPGAPDVSTRNVARSVEAELSVCPGPSPNTTCCAAQARRIFVERVSCTSRHTAPSARRLTVSSGRPGKWEPIRGSSPAARFPTLPSTEDSTTSAPVPDLSRALSSMAATCGSQSATRRRISSSTTAPAGDCHTSRRESTPRAMSSILSYETTVPVDRSRGSWPTESLTILASATFSITWRFFAYP